MSARTVTTAATSPAELRPHAVLNAGDADLTFQPEGAKDRAMWRGEQLIEACQIKGDGAACALEIAAAECATAGIRIERVLTGSGTRFGSRQLGAAVAALERGTCASEQESAMSIRRGTCDGAESGQI